MTLRLILVRHGLSSFNKDFRIQGRNDLSKLTNEGQLQSIETGKLLSNLNISYVYSSPLQRAVETTKGIVSQITTEIIPSYTNDLLEIDLEPWSGLTKEEVKSKFPESFFTWQKNPNDLVIQRPDGTIYKPMLDLISQANNFLNKILKKHYKDYDQNILIVGHNAILKCLILNLLGNTSEGFRRFQIDNASISIISFQSKSTNPYEIQLESLNNTVHLNQNVPPHKSDKRIILVRHGETNWNLEGRFQGQIDIPLNKTGQIQALSAQNFLKDININKAFSSSMSRPKETAEIILKTKSNIKLELKKDLIEISHGLWEGKLESEINENWSDLLKAWKKFPQTVQMPEGETIKEVSSRSIKCFKEICENLNNKDTALIVAHDAVNKTILCNLLGLKEADIWKVKQGNGGITILDINNDHKESIVVRCLNITSHLGGVIDKTATGAL